MTDSAKRPAPILAAGGIVLRGNTRPRFAVVRMRREKAWVLPKGKLLPREHPRIAAKREVLEETGYDVTVHEFLGSMAYAIEGKIKIVQFWLMRAVGAPVHELMDDVKAVKWLAAEASRRNADAPARKTIPHPCRADRARPCQKISARKSRTTVRKGAGSRSRKASASRRRTRDRGGWQDQTERIRQGARQLDRAHHAIGDA